MGVEKNIFNCGKPGAGEIAKLCNNMALAIQMIGISEALAIGKRLGMDVNNLVKLMNVSSSRCWSTDTYNPIPGYFPTTPATNNYDGGFACELMLKDIKLALEAANIAKVDAVMGTKSK
jgi:3-hydroxyisobutyrate dehydrogenase